MASQGGGSGFFGSIFNFLGKALFSKKFYMFGWSVIFTIILFYSSIITAIRTGEWGIFFKDFGGIIAGADAKLLYVAQHAGEYGQWEFYLVLLGTLWFYYVILRLLYLPWKFRRPDERGKNVLIALLSFAILQMIFYSIVYKTFYPPFQGLLYFATHADTIFESFNTIAKTEMSGFQTMLPNDTIMNQTAGTGFEQANVTWWHFW